MFGGMKFGMFDFELALALGGAAFQTMEVTKGDGTTAVLDGARFFFSVQQFQFTPKIGGKQLSFDIGNDFACFSLKICNDMWTSHFVKSVSNHFS